MKKSNKNIYYNDYLQFYIEKPEDWVFIPQKWAINFKEKSAENTPELKEAIKKAVMPFVYFYKPHEEPEYPLPTVQCGCRLNCTTSDYDLEDFMHKMINEGLVKVYSRLEIIEANSNFILSGYRSIFIRMKFIINNLDNEPIWCLGRVFMVVTPQLIFNIGMTGSLAEKYCCEDIFTQVIHSIKLGKKYLQSKDKL